VHITDRGFSASKFISFSKSYLSPEVLITNSDTTRVKRMQDVPFDVNSWSFEELKTIVEDFLKEPNDLTGEDRFPFGADIEANHESSLFSRKKVLDSLLQIADSKSTLASPLMDDEIQSNRHDDDMIASLSDCGECDHYEQNHISSVFETIQ
jgi:hypothetical protein